MGMFHEPKKSDKQYRDETVIFCEEPSLTKQEFLDDADVNKLIARCLRVGGQLPGQEVVDAFRDVSAVGDFMATMEIMRNAESAFMSLDPQLRSRFGNQPYLLVEWLRDVRNRDEAVKLGLVAKPKASEPGVVEPVAPVVPPTK